MTKLSFSKLGLSKVQEANEVQYGENKIEVLKYLDIATKSTMINAAVRGAVIEGVVDEVLLDAYLHIFIVENYTNITLSPKQRDNILDTFDAMESNGFFSLIIEAMEPGEYEYIFAMAKKLMDSVNKYNQSFVSILGNSEDIIKNILLQAQSSGQTQ